MKRLTAKKYSTDSKFSTEVINYSRQKSPMHYHSLWVLNYQPTASFEPLIRAMVMTCIDFRTAAMFLCAAPGFKMSESQESASLTFCIYNKPLLSLLTALVKRNKPVLTQYNVNTNMCCLFLQIFDEDSFGCIFRARHFCFII